jgi:hypothetical protein
LQGDKKGKECVVILLLPTTRRVVFIWSKHSE